MDDILTIGRGGFERSDAMGECEAGTADLGYN